MHRSSSQGIDGGMGAEATKDEEKGLLLSRSPSLVRNASVVSSFGGIWGVGGRGAGGGTSASVRM
jgi:hypothetical protein